ncbi:hypothetical protein ACFL04_00875 [Patescibacteria group bacterium]
MNRESYTPNPEDIEFQAPADSTETEKTKSGGVMEYLNRFKLGKRASIAVLIAELGAGGLAFKAQALEIVRRPAKDKAATERIEQTELAAKDSRIREIYGDHANYGYRSEMDNRASDIIVSEQNRNVEYYSRSARAARSADQAEPREGQEPVLSDISVSWTDEEGELHEAVVDQGRFREVITETYPQNWVSTEVDTIAQYDETEPLPEKYGPKAGDEAAATYYHGDDYNTIIMHAPTKEYAPDHVLNDLLPHELGHANDWESDNDMSIEGRADMLLAIYERLQSDDRYQSAYVEAIENEDEKLEMYLKATEYWAEICAMYFSQPGELDQKDFELVDNWVREADPDFDIYEANDKRWDHLDKIYEGK